MTDNGEDAARDRAARTSQTVFLERRSYRRRRLADAARLLPVLGAVLFMIPLLWPDGQAGADAGTSMRTSQAIVYIFGIWAALIVISGLVGLGARHWGQSDRPDRSDGAE